MGQYQPEQAYMVYLRQQIAACFDEQELITLCFDLSISYEDLPGQGKGAKIRDLLAYVNRRQRLQQLLVTLRQRRPDAAWESPARTEQVKRIFISYKRDMEPDEPVALQILEALEEQHNVFLDQTMLVGTQWAERIEAEIGQADIFIALLSAESVHSEMVEDEIALAHHLSRFRSDGTPVILPVRLNYRQPFHYPLSEYLNHINWAFWENQDDTLSLIEELQQAISGGNLSIDEHKQGNILQKQTKLPRLPKPTASAQPAHLEMPEGTMAVESAFYVERKGDRVALDAIRWQGVTITIKAPRQMGKSSLLIRTKEAAIEEDKRVAFLDFQLFDKRALTDADTFYRQFFAWLTHKLKLEDRLEDYWKPFLGITQRCTEYVEEYLLPSLDKPLVIAMDEVERMFDTDFRSDFFSMLRSWHNSRATDPIWKQLDMVLVTSTEPYQLIENLHQSPFNVGEVIELNDFTQAQVADLNRRHQLPLNEAEEQRLFDLLNGHPYLVRRALYLVASQRISAADLFAQSIEDRGPFGDHLRNHLFRLHDKAELIRGMRTVLDDSAYQDERVFFRLRGAGLVRKEGSAVVPRCQLYADFFKDRLHD